MVALGTPVGHEQGLERPCLVVSDQGFVNTVHVHKMLITVPGSRTRHENPRTHKVILTHVEVAPTAANGLTAATYFMAEQIRSLSLARFRRYVGTLESRHVKTIEDSLCLVMSLFKSGST